MKNIGHQHRYRSVNKMQLSHAGHIQKNLRKAQSTKNSVGGCTIARYIVVHPLECNVMENEQASWHDVLLKLGVFC